MTKLDLRRLLETAAATVPPTPQNLSAVTRRAKSLRRRRRLTGVAAAALLTLPALQAWNLLSDRSPSILDPGPVASATPSGSPSPALPRTSVQQMRILSNLNSVRFPDDELRGPHALLLPGATLTELPVAGNPPADGGKAYGPNGSIAGVEHAVPPTHNDGDECSDDVRQTLTVYRTGAPKLEAQLPSDCALYTLIGLDDQFAYLQLDHKQVVSYHLATGRLSTLFTPEYPLAFGFEGRTLAVAQFAQPPRPTGDHFECKKADLTVHTIDVQTGQQRSRIAGKGTPCHTVYAVRPSPDGTRVALLREVDLQARVEVVDMLTGGVRLTDTAGDLTQRQMISVAWADDRTVWVAWFGRFTTQPPPPLRDVLRTSAFQVR